MGRPRSMLTRSTEMLKNAIGLLETRLNESPDEIKMKDLMVIIATLYRIQQKEQEITMAKMPGALPHRYQGAKMLSAGPEGTMEDPWGDEPVMQDATNGEGSG